MGTITKLPSKSFFDFIYTLYLFSGKRKRRVDDAAVAEVTKKLAECHLNVSDISLEVRMYTCKMWYFVPNRAFTVCSRDGAVVRALASHQCGPGLIPNLCIIHGLGLLLVLFDLSFLCMSTLFPSPQKPTFPNFQRVSPINTLCAK